MDTLKDKQWLEGCTRAVRRRGQLWATGREADRDLAAAAG